MPIVLLYKWRYSDPRHISYMFFFMLVPIRTLFIYYDLFKENINTLINPPLGFEPGSFVQLADDLSAML